MEPIADRSGQVVGWLGRELIYDAGGLPVGLLAGDTVARASGEAVGVLVGGFFLDRSGDAVAFLPDWDAACGPPPPRVADVVPPVPGLGFAAPVVTPLATTLPTLAWSELGWEELLP